jgi:hypothetical protein
MAWRTTVRCAALMFALAGWTAAAERLALEAAPSPVDNPLKGLVPYAGDHAVQFPHSLEFNYLSLGALVKGRDQYDWAPLERLIGTIAERGHQTVFRVYSEYPGTSGALPTFLLDEGLKVERYLNTNDVPPTPNETPDYKNPALRECLVRFIAALGKRYDGDPRIGFITAGLLGAWGEWHNWPRDELFADIALQNDVMTAYEKAFARTPVLLRYPAGDGDARHAPNGSRPFGYHDDSFAWGTLETGRPGDNWFYMHALRNAGAAAMEKWRTQPIGGEIRPEAWGIVFDEGSARPELQDFGRCVEATHVTWLMDTGMFRGPRNAARIARAAAAVRRMGYDFTVASVELGRPKNGRVDVAWEVTNRGVAPFYADWPATIGLLRDGAVVRSAPAVGKLAGILPGEARTWRESVDVSGLPAGRHIVAVRVANPMPRGHPVRFGNRAQDADAPEWLSLGEVTLP